MLRSKLDLAIASKVVCLTIVFATSAMSMAATVRVDRWNDLASGAQAARQAISQCLARANRTPNMRREFCVRAAYEVCEAEHGNMSQRDLNECAFFSQQAWEERLEVVKQQLGSLAAKKGAAAKSNIAVEKLRESERRWEEWKQEDCDIQASIHAGGTMQPFIKRMCLSRNAANRALDLDTFIDWIN